jgi:hypothetical protein
MRLAGKGFKGLVSRSAVSVQRVISHHILGRYAVALRHGEGVVFIEDEERGALAPLLWLHFARQRFGEVERPKRIA